MGLIRLLRPAPLEFATARCRVDRPRRGDRPALHALLRDEPVWRHLGGLRRGDRAEAWVDGVLGRGGGVVRAVRHDGLAGVLFLSPHHDEPTPEVSYLLRSDLWGRGLAAEAVGAFVSGALSLGHGRILAETQAANGASRRLLERLGFAEERRVECFGAEQVIYAIRPEPARRS